MARRARGGRGGDYEHKVLIWSRPPAILKVNCPKGAREGGLGHWFLSHRWERNSPPGRRNSPATEIFTARWESAASARWANSPPPAGWPGGSAPWWCRSTWPAPTGPLLARP